VYGILYVYGIFYELGVFKNIHVLKKIGIFTSMEVLKNISNIIKMYPVIWVYQRGAGISSTLTTGSTEGHREW